MSEIQLRQIDKSLKNIEAALRAIVVELRKANEG